MADTLANILAGYGAGYQSPALTGDGEIYDTSNVLGRMSQGNTATRGMRGLADLLQRDSAPQNLLSGGLNTAANWLDWRPEIGADTLTPFGLAALGSGPFGAATRMIRPASQARPIEQNMRLYRGEPKTLNADPERAGGWWTRSIDRAKGFAGPEGNVYVVDVPLARMGELQSKASGTNYILPHDLRAQRKLLPELLDELPPMPKHKSED